MLKAIQNEIHGSILFFTKEVLLKLYIPQIGTIIHLIL